MRYPNGCPSQRDVPRYNRLQDPSTWVHETFDDASKSLKFCYARRLPLNEWCGVSDSRRDSVIVHFVEGD